MLVARGQVVVVVGCAPVAAVGRLAPAVAAVDWHADPVGQDFFADILPSTG